MVYFTHSNNTEQCKLQLCIVTRLCMQHLSTHAEKPIHCGSQHRQRHITPHTELKSHHHLTPAVKKLIGSIHTCNKGLIYDSFQRPYRQLYSCISWRVKSGRCRVLTGMLRGDPLTQCCIDACKNKRVICAYMI